MSDLFSAVDPSSSPATIPVEGQRRNEPGGSPALPITDVIPDHPTDPAPSRATN